MTWVIIYESLNRVREELTFWGSFVWCKCRLRFILSVHDILTIFFIMVGFDATILKQYPAKLYFETGISPKICFITKFSTNQKCFIIVCNQIWPFSFANKKTLSDMNFHLHGSFHKSDWCIGWHSTVRHIWRIDHVSLSLILRDKIGRTSIILFTEDMLRVWAI